MAEQTRRQALVGTRIVGALALLVIGAVHYQQYRYAFYSAVPTIGPLFIVNFVAGTGVGLVLLIPGKSRLGHLGTLIDPAAALAALGLAAGGVAALLYSEHAPLFGFMEHGYRFVIVLTLASEATAIVVLSAFLTLGWPELRNHARRSSVGPAGEVV